MMKITIHVVALATFSSLPLLAQQAASDPAPSESIAQIAIPAQEASSNNFQDATAKAVPVPSTANSPEVGNAQLRPVPGELVSQIDTRNAKTGDPIVIRTTEKATTASGIEIPRGSRIVGHITDVQPKGKSSDNARMTIQFDQAELKGGQNLPIRSVIQSLAPAGSSGGMDGMGTNSASAVSPTSGSTAANRGAVTSGATATPADGPSGTSGAGSQSGSTLPGTIVARNGSIAVRTTSIPGVLLAGNVNGQPFSNAAGALLGAKQNVHLDGGTMMVLAIMQAPSGANAR
ncbi:MAG TPA: hypothetical protein VGG85_05490 [Terracidiphilus sp.]|jgi:hypothetical protein